MSAKTPPLLQGRCIILVFVRDVANNMWVITGTWAFVLFAKWQTFLSRKNVFILLLFL